MILATSVLFLSTLIEVSAFSLPICSSRPPQTRAQAIAGQQQEELDPTLSTYDCKEQAHKNPLKHSFEKNGGILYRTSVFSPTEYAILQRELSQMMQRRLTEETASSVASNRRGAPLSLDSESLQIFRHGSLLQLFQKITSRDYELSNEIPVEIRTYEKKGACMQWHVDDVLTDPPQLEVVWTLQNTSDCCTMYRTPDATMQVETDANSVLLLRAGGVRHCVSSLN
jgi:hypothetical protein